jgi:hypothetical protein
LDCFRGRVNQFLDFAIYDAIKKATNSKQKNNTASEEYNRNPTATGISGIQNFSQINPPDRNQNRAQKKHYCTRKCIKESLEIVGILGGLIGIVGGLVGLRFLWLQYGEMIKSTNATKDAVIVAQGQLEEMRTNRHLDERAWVLATSVKDIMALDYYNAYTVDVSFKNTGKTPAINVKSFCNWAAKEAEIPKTDDIIKAWENEALCAPNSGGEIQPLIPIPKTILDHAYSGAPIFIYGTIRYDDIFTNSHLSQFCYKIISHDVDSGRFEYTGCDIHNSCDDAEPNQAR